MKEFGIEGDADYGSDDDDSDFEFDEEGMEMYDSAIDDIDEITYLKEAITQIHAADANLYNHLMAGVKNLDGFQQLMTGLDALIAEEKSVREQIEAIEKKNK